MDAMFRNLKRSAGLLLLGLFVPGGSLVVLAIHCAERAWKRNGSGDSSPLSTIQEVDGDLGTSPW